MMNFCNTISKKAYLMNNFIENIKKLRSKDWLIFLKKKFLNESNLIRSFFTFYKNLKIII